METVVLEVIHEQGLELQITFNKGAVMVLPPGDNKASGLEAALQALGLSRHNVVGAGDAENDHAFLSICGCSVAVANALPAVKEGADLVVEPSGADAVLRSISWATVRLRCCEEFGHSAAPWTKAQQATIGCGNWRHLGRRFNLPRHAGAFSHEAATLAPYGYRPWHFWILRSSSASCWPHRLGL